MNHGEYIMFGIGMWCLGVIGGACLLIHRDRVKEWDPLSHVYLVMALVIVIGFAWTGGLTFFMGVGWVKKPSEIVWSNGK